MIIRNVSVIFHDNLDDLRKERDIMKERKNKWDRLECTVYIIGIFIGFLIMFLLFYKLKLMEGFDGRILAIIGFFAGCFLGGFILALIILMILEIAIAADFISSLKQKELPIEIKLSFKLENKKILYLDTDGNFLSYRVGEYDSGKVFLDIYGVNQYVGRKDLKAKAVVDIPQKKIYIPYTYIN